MSSKSNKKTMTNKKKLVNNEDFNKEPNKESNEEFNNETIENEKKNNKIILMTSNLHKPSTNTSLVSPIMLYPNQMDNKMHIHIKTNLINKLENKCFKNYGYINKIYTIEETSDGIIEAEDPSCSAKIIVKFTCNLCLPIIGKEIVCKIDRMNKVLISGINGPIKIIITVDKINKDKFFPDVNRNIRIKENSKIIVPDIYIKVMVLSRSFSDYDKNIIVIGFLQDIATQEEIDIFMIQDDSNDDYNFIEEI